MANSAFHMSRGHVLLSVWSAWIVPWLVVLAVFSFGAFLFILLIEIAHRLITDSVPPTQDGFNQFME